MVRDASGPRGDDVRQGAARTAPIECARSPPLRSPIPMPLARLVPAMVAMLVLGAHFYRASEWIPLAVVVALIALAPLRRRWIPWLWQAALVLGTVEWLRTLAELVAVRRSLGAPWMRLAAILGAVALATLACALLFRLRSVRAYYDAAPPIAQDEAARNDAR